MIVVLFENLNDLRDSHASHRVPLGLLVRRSNSLWELISYFAETREVGCALINNLRLCTIS